ncbi:5-oxoprolinase subunit PxpB [Alcaligenaceae bacterium]|nr:5-oxoprolinase subunit PxpB [Alcaligenaceae bacterium]
MPENVSGPDTAWTITPQGDRCLLLAFGDGIDIETGRLCGKAASALRAAGLAGVSDIVPAFNSVAVHYQPRLFRPRGALQELMDQIRLILADALSGGKPAEDARQVDIPVCYGGEHGPDLEDVARHCGLSPQEVIRLHSGTPAYVFMLGFAPGAPYIGIHDPKLAIGRRDTPRTVVPAGSVAIANLQTVIYPNASPGGWNLIGSTPSVLFDPAREPVTLLAPGDTVRFVPIGPDDYLALKRASK